MIPKLIQKQGALHLADEDAAAEVLLAAPSVVPLPDPPRHVLELVPESVARENVVLPVRLDGDTLFVAAADPDNLLVSDKLTFILNKKVRLVRWPRETIVAAINRHYGQTRTESVSSMLTADIELSVKITPVLRLARAARISPFGAAMPHSPVGARMSGVLMRWPNTVVD